MPAPTSRPSTTRPRSRATSCGPWTRARPRSASSTASSTSCPRSGTRRSSSRSSGGCRSTGRRAWARSGPPSSTRSGWSAWGRSSSGTPRASSRTTTRWPSRTARPSSATGRSPRRWSTSGTRSRRLSSSGSSDRISLRGWWSAPRPGTTRTGPSPTSSGRRPRSGPARTRWSAWAPSSLRAAVRSRSATPGPCSTSWLRTRRPAPARPPQPEPGAWSGRSSSPTC